ncbi:hypothetical protein APA22_24000 [Acetobacter pasteurianus IFO 3283-22]|uniref:Uncharacterized protein n=2 Tax=Acetobacter pasteurianus TaxID=438 RepID=C7JFC3_ACEP3|nr:hypothetical protein S101468_01698 [Acetobacter pasteurianus subsp. pasteurianus]BAI00513.1 hypothetical protein APA01_24000 [Acetobacter pasteurianus IFO 3283-01]BAI03564.1 hypothetical protein APA03_24000 [Acetobacter pasteurianus IFO 3283-03]BAI06609.1 hypothetical protein APA07_24000 [Acetobacter pasteurianus IFO 3283-07]BAI09659.1 hypothetical protein APA22_24000 [Acetobacter pasteurianus IFO 3283-22]BAI12707.1 hypothetical protein APA26_24000 [Acetobacter pasteurianus IFO 3283-26]BAI
MSDGGIGVYAVVSRVIMRRLYAGATSVHAVAVWPSFPNATVLMIRHGFRGGGFGRYSCTSERVSVCSPDRFEGRFIVRLFRRPIMPSLLRIKGCFPAFIFGPAISLIRIMPDKKIKNDLNCMEIGLNY